MGCEPSLDGRHFAIGQERHDTAALKIANDRSIAMVSAEGPVVDADHVQRSGVCAGAPAYNPQQRIVTHRKHQPPGEGGRWPAAKRQAEMMDETFESARPARANWQHSFLESFGEYLSWAVGRCAAKAPRNDAKANAMTRTRQVRRVPEIAAMDAT
jgi:hypothetical protein